MVSSMLGEAWNNLSIWRKSALALFLVMWVAFSSGVITLTSENLVIMTVFLCLLWLSFVVLAFIITRVGEEY